MGKPKTMRCKGCGEVLDEDAGSVIRVTPGELVTKSEKLRFCRDGEPWGVMHERCFKIAIGDPDSIDLLAVSA